MILRTLIQEVRVYTGKALEKGGTSIAGKEVAMIRKLFTKGTIKGKVLDYGAGKYGRNANYLREQGLEVYAYDPFNGSDVDGWNGVSKTKPRTKFDTGFSTYVLNVVPTNIEKDIIGEVASMSKHQIHITRNLDIFDSIKKAFKREDKNIVSFFKKEFANNNELKALEDGSLTDEIILAFCEFGVQTSRGFQRIPTLEQYGYKLLNKTNGYKVYSK